MIESGEQARSASSSSSGQLRMIESGEQARSASSSSSAGIRNPRTRRPRESRKTPFTRSPPRRSLRGDDDLDEILKAQQREDEANPTEGYTALPKRKREVLSDTDFRLRKERTDGLVEGLWNVRELSTYLPGDGSRQILTLLLLHHLVRIQMIRIERMMLGVCKVLN